MFDLTLDLHRFDGEGAAPAEASAEATESGTQEQGTAAEQVSAEDRNAEFERFIGEYRDLYDERMKNAVNTRLKSFKGIENKLKAEQEKTKIINYTRHSSANTWVYFFTFCLDF